MLNLYALLLIILQQLLSQQRPYQSKHSVANSLPPLSINLWCPLPDSIAKNPCLGGFYDYVFVFGELHCLFHDYKGSNLVIQLLVYDNLLGNIQFSHQQLVPIYTWRCTSFFKLPICAPLSFPRLGHLIPQLLTSIMWLTHISPFGFGSESSLPECWLE